jgi:AcrR family transcriptional regulator
MNAQRVTRNVEAGKRQYRSALRTAQARETRHVIVSAANRLFIEMGFGSTTVDAVADAAGVSRKTVFTAVGGKVELLKLAIEWAITGDNDPVALADRPEIVALLQQTDPAALLRGWARFLVEIDARVAPLLRALEIAAEVDTTARSLYEQLQSQRLEGARTIVNRLAELGALRGDLAPDEAADLAWLSGDPSFYDRLVRQRGWSIERFEQWVARGLVHQLTRDGE